MIIWRNTQTHRAFTLVETLLVLAVISCFSLLPVLAVKRWQEELAVAHFFSRFEKMLLVSQQIAIVEKYQTTLTVDRGKRMVTFATIGTDGKTGSDFEEDSFSEIIIPEAIYFKTADETRFSFSTQSGSPSALRKVSFYRKDKPITVSYQIQMGSARFEKTVE